MSIQDFKNKLAQKETLQKTELVDKLGTDKIDLSDNTILDLDLVKNHIEKNAKVYEKGSSPDDKSLDTRLSEDEIYEQEEKFIKRVDEFQNTLNSLDENGKKLFIEETFNRLGIPKELAEKVVQAGEFAWQKSDIFKTLAIYVITQEVKSKMVSYGGAVDGWVPNEEFANGVVQYMYHDYTEADETPAWKDVEISDYNQGTNITTYEVYRARKNIHKGYDILDSRLNDVAKSTAIFMTIMNDLQMNIARPMAKIIFRYKLQAIADPFTNLEFNGIDISAQTPDMTITATDEIDFITQLNTLFGEGGTAYSVGRERNEKAEWLPDGFTTQLELEFSKEDTQIMMDTAIWNKLMTNQEVRNTYNLKLLSLPDFVRFNYKLFASYGKITGVMATATEFDLFIKIGTPVKLITHYNLSKKSDTPVAKQVYNAYTRLGIAVNKIDRMYRVRVKITPAS